MWCHRDIPLQPWIESNVCRIRHRPDAPWRPRREITKRFGIPGCDGLEQQYGPHGGDKDHTGHNVGDGGAKRRGCCAVVRRHHQHAREQTIVDHCGGCVRQLLLHRHCCCCTAVQHVVAMRCQVGNVLIEVGNIIHSRRMMVLPNIQHNGHDGLKGVVALCRGRTAK